LAEEIGGDDTVDAEPGGNRADTDPQSRDRCAAQHQVPEQIPVVNNLLRRLRDVDVHIIADTETPGRRAAPAT